MLPHLPLKTTHRHFHPFHLTPSREKIRRERAPPPNGAPQTSALNPRNCRTAHNEDLQEARGEPSVPGDSPVFLEEIEPFGLARAAENADVGGVEPLGIDAYGRGGMQPVADAAPALAESTSGIELAGEAERAVTVEHEALEPWAYGEAGSGQETPVQGGKSRLEPLPRGDAERKGRMHGRDAAARGRARA